MVVILCGCDGTGKSTCFSKLRESMNANFIKESYTSDESKKLLRSLYTSTRVDDHEITIYDRATILDDLVYQRVMANKESNLIFTVGVDTISSVLNRSVVIYFDLDDFALTERLLERGDDFITIHQVNKIKKSYNEIFKKFNINHITLDTTGLSEDDVYNKVKGIIENEKLKNS